MPRLNPSFPKTVCFLTARKDETPDGTGVFIGIGGDRISFGSMYVVTAAHVASHSPLFVRINTKDNKSRTFEIHPDEWRSPVSGADIAAADVTDKIDRDFDDYRYITPSWFAGKEFLQRADIGIGEDGFMLGMFAGHPGSDRNLVAAKFGNVSLLAADDAPISPSRGRPAIPSHLFDLRSRGGFSGSPVFIYRTPDADLTMVTDGQGAWAAGSLTDWEARFGTNEHDIAENLFIRLLGIHVTQFRERVQVYKTPNEESDYIKHGDALWIEGGVTIVVPAWEVEDLLNRDDFKEQRRQREEMMMRPKGKGPEPMLESAKHAKPEPPTTGVKGDDQHKERFTALLDAAVGKPKQGG